MITTPRIAAIVPMRHSSERIPNKNHADFRGKPLFMHILGALLACPGIAEVVIDTDSPTIADHCRRNRLPVTLLDRPERLRDGAIPMNDVLRNSIAHVSADLYLQTHSTNPLLRPLTIERAIAAFLDGRDRHDSLFGVTRWQTRLYDADARPVNHNPAVLQRTQDLPPIFEENSNLYIFSADSFAATGARIGRRPMLFEIDRLESIDIDDHSGWKLAEAVAAARLVEALP